MALLHVAGLTMAMVVAGQPAPFATALPPASVSDDGPKRQSAPPAAAASRTAPAPLTPETGAALREAAQDLQIMRMEWRAGSGELERARNMRARNMSVGSGDSS